jgi:hypothetical protein
MADKYLQLPEKQALIWIYLGIARLLLNNRLQCMTLYYNEMQDKESLFTELFSTTSFHFSYHVSKLAI